MAKTDPSAVKKSTVGKPSTGRPTQSTHESKPASPDRVSARAQAGKKHGTGKAEKPRGVVRRAAASVRRVLARVTGRDAEPEKKPSTKPPAARVTRRDADIPMDRISQTYTPTQTSLKGPFRTSGADRQRDQEFASGVADDRWNDEDRFTNKSGDPRIGTHNRSYEPGEARAASGKPKS